MNVFEYVLITGVLLIFSFLVGILFQGIERKLVARLQNRIGPPILQPLYDILKLLSKETMVPRKAIRTVFLLAPLVSLSAMLTAVLLVPILTCTEGADGTLCGGVSYWDFAGDIIVLLYVIVLSSIGVILGASSSGSPFAAIGASREITLIISFELPLVLAVLSAAFMAKSFSLNAIANNGSYLLIIGAVVYIACMLGELARAPFHIADAETEIVEGIYTEYSGGLLAAYKIAEALKFYVFPMLFVVLFIPIPNIGVLGILLLQLMVALSAVVFTAIVEAVSGRFKIHQASGFYLKGILVFAVVQLMVAVIV
ncbi:MAG: complex I subunit 1 family protein [Candidatus Micrarchaeota archaeon]